MYAMTDCFLKMTNKLLDTEIVKLILCKIESIDDKFKALVFIFISEVLTTNIKPYIEV